ncbi:MAG: alpha-ketoacid dehydrogenase subunit beta [Candidatus Heimdallarchaeota archaeon]|nr:alpha-ketoacid dehydrogenase subunit beta [Candidatus Heimdallarchaeota archaeon]MDH5646956.1 alpha-ketoacid dehydrogenase subunit beta [Candidatus Heimdallarchaeota archaeon]
MVELNIVDAIKYALEQEMDRDKDVIILGEDIGKNGGVFRATQGLYDKFGPERVLDTPLNESGIIGFAVGMSLYGIKAVPEIQFIDFIFPAFDQILSELAKFRYRSGGQFTCPVVIRSPYGGGVRGAHYHSQSPESLFAHTPGLKVVVPSNPYDAKGLLISAIRSNDPVIFMEPKRIYRAFKEEVPEDDYTVPLESAAITREGKDVTLISYGAMLHITMDAADLASEEGIDCEVIDLRTIYPLDIDTIEESVKKTGRVISVTEAPKTAGFGAELSALVAERWIEYMEAPIIRVAGYDVPFPFVLEHDYMPTPERVLDSIRYVYNY